MHSENACTLKTHRYTRLEENMATGLEGKEGNPFKFSIFRGGVVVSAKQISSAPN
jgi:hypothetical protein